MCLHTWDVLEWPHRYILRRFWHLRQVSYLEPVAGLFYGDKDTSRFRYVFIKLHMMSLVQYDKIVFLDTDTLVLQSIDDLFALQAPAAMRRGMNVTAAQSHGSPIDGTSFFATDEHGEWAWGQGTGINAGVMVVAPDWDTYQRMLSEIRCSNHPAHVGGTGPEQDYLSRFWADAPWTHIGVEYNFQLHQLYNALDPWCAQDAERTALLGDSSDFKQIRVVHFSGELKPWHRHLGPGPSSSEDDFVQQLLRSFSGWWLWVKKDREWWEAMQSRPEECRFLGENGRLYYMSRQGHGSKEVVSDDSELHQSAERFIQFAQHMWDQAWLDAQKEYEESALQGAQDYHCYSDSCWSCGDRLPYRSSHLESEYRRWCRQCWWEYQPASGSRITVTASRDVLYLHVDGQKFQLMLREGFEASAAWLVLLSFEHQICSLAPRWFFDCDLASVAASIKQLSFGCPVVVAGFGVQSRFDQLWCALADCGCPAQISVGDHAFELGHDAMAFAMVGVHGLRPGSAVFSASRDVATATRRI